MVESLAYSLETAPAEVRDAILLDHLLDAMDGALQRALFAAAIPHWFDAGFLSALLLCPQNSATIAIDRLAQLAIVEDLLNSTYKLHDSVRSMLLSKFWESDQSQFRDVSERAMTYCERPDHDDPSWYIESIYHRFIVDEASVPSRLRNTWANWFGLVNFGPGALNAIAGAAREHTKANRLRELNLDWIKVWMTMIVQNDKRFRLALTLEGGGATCSYQAGVYQALQQADLAPDTIVAESIGAITAAIIAGNEPDRRLDRLKEFWEMVTGSPLSPLSVFWPPFIPRSLLTVANGVPGFFIPRPFSGAGPFGLSQGTSLYDMSPLRQTLERLVDFDRINDRKIHFVVSAVDEANGEVVYFDNRTTRIAPEHIMASCALPPGFPSVEINGRKYWDASLVAKTPIQYLLGEASTDPLLVFQVELKQIGTHPLNDMQQITTRANAIQYASRGQLVSSYYRNIEKVNRMLRRALQKIPEAELSEEEVRLRQNLAEEPLIAVVNLSDRGHSTDEAHDFDKSLMQDRWERGYSSTANVLRGLDQEKLASGSGVMVYSAEGDDF